MQWRFFLYCFFISQLVTAQHTFSKFSRQQLTDDINYMAQTMENVHVNLYHSTSKEKFLALKDSITLSFKDSMTSLEAWPLFARLMGAVNEGHGELQYPDEFGIKVQSGTIEVFPVLVKSLQNDKLLVNYNLSDDSSLKKGDAIIAINGIKVLQLIELLTSGLGGLQSWKEVRVMNDFLSYLWFYGIRSPFTIDYLQEGKQKTITVNAVTFSTLKARMAELIKTLPAQPQPGPYEFKRTEDNIGYLDFRTMDTDYDAFENFIKQTFKEVKSRSVDGLIIDMRKNGGGNSNLGYLLLQYITGKPFRMAGGSKWKVSQEIKDFYTNADSSYKERTASKPWKKYLRKNNGEFIVGDGGKPLTPKENALRYNGKVCVLIGPTTFSSANMTANAIQDYHLTTLIGEATGEVPNDYGEVFILTLPNTKIQVRTTTALFIRANGNAEDNNPVLPNIEVKQNLTSSKDDVLEFAKEWIKKNN